MTTNRYKTDKIADDPTDNKFLACALEADVDYIVSGDNHLLSLKHFHRIQIVDAASFIEQVKVKDKLNIEGRCSTTASFPPPRLPHSVFNALEQNGG